jgi:predicted Zn-dependent protease
VSYENPEIPEGINDSDRRPVLHALKLYAIALALVAAMGAALLAAADWLAPLVPFRYETAATRGFFPPKVNEGAIEPYLRELTGRLARAQGLPEDMTIEAHYNEGDVVNAFATLGGHVVLYQGLLQAMPDENALAMVIAHEIAHVRHRHPIASVGRAAGMGFALMLLGADSGSQLVQATVSQGGILTMLSFSRAQESQADATALETVQRLYGHVDGADSFFQQMLSKAQSREPPRFLSSHPLTAPRIEALGALADQQGWKRTGPRTPIPAPVRAEIERRARKASPDKLAPDAPPSLQPAG